MNTALLESADAIKLLHFRATVHRDLLPSNVLLTADTTAQILDFDSGRNTTVPLAGLLYAPLPANLVEQERRFVRDDATIVTSESVSYYSHFAGHGVGITLGNSPASALEILEKTNLAAAQRLRHLAYLEPGWDGYGGNSLTQESIELASALLLAVQQLTKGQLESPFIAPMPDGGVELEWELASGGTSPVFSGGATTSRATASGTGKELMIVIPPGGSGIRFLLVEPTSSGDLDETEGTIPTDATLSELARRLIS